MKIGLTVLLGIVFFCVGCKAEDGTQKTDERTSTAKKTRTKKQIQTQDTESGKPVAEKEDDLAIDDQEDAESLLVGIWQVDVSSIPATAEILELPTEERAPALQNLRDTMRNVAYEFAADGKLNIFLGGQSKQTGSYEIKRAKSPDPKKTHIVFVEARTVGPIGAKTERWEVKVHTKSLFVRDVATGQKMRLFRGAPGLQPTP